MLDVFTIFGGSPGEKLCLCWTMEKIEVCSSSGSRILLFFIESSLFIYVGWIEMTLPSPLGSSNMDQVHILCRVVVLNVIRHQAPNTE